jgi:site-specific recombinase XerD
LRHLREQPLVEIARVPGSREHAIALTKEGRSRQHASGERRSGATYCGSACACRRLPTCRLLADDVDIRVVPLILGHSDIKTTQRYLNITDEELRRALTGVGNVGGC